MLQRIARFLGVGAFSALLVSHSAPAYADDGSIDIQLNAAKASAQGCRVSFVLQNKLPNRIEELTFEIVLFDAKGGVSEFLLLKAGSLPSGKIRVRQFDLKNHACGDISQVLVNDVKACQGEGLTAGSCLDRLKPTSATPIKLVM